jgi:hypothetical protein
LLGKEPFGRQFILHAINLYARLLRYYPKPVLKFVDRANGVPAAVEIDQSPRIPSFAFLFSRLGREDSDGDCSVGAADDCELYGVDWGLL